MADILYIDFETYSEVDLKAQGSKRYAEDESTQVICLGYAFDNEPVQLWSPRDQEIPETIIRHVSDSRIVCAHNVVFDYRIWNGVLVRDFFVPELHISQCIDSMAVCLSFSIPAKLKEAGEALGIKHLKFASGTTLINLLSKPNKHGEQNQYFEFKEKFEQMFDYCKRDIEAMREILNTLPRQALIPIEQQVWLMTNEMNEVGLPVDINEVKVIHDYIKGYVDQSMYQIGNLTGGAASKITQTIKLKDWCISQGVDLPNFQAETITKLLKFPEDLPEKVCRILELRQELGRTSTAKFKKLMDLEYGGYVFDNLQYHGAGPGRWSGRGFQMQNLPRAKVPNPEEYIDMFMTGKAVEDPVKIGKALIRSMIKAPPGYNLIVTDYSSIENRVLAYLAGDEETLDGFRRGYDQYIDMAAEFFNVPYNQIDPYGDQRQFGKVIILGAGYMMGADRFVEVAEDWGFKITLETAKLAIKAYREKYWLIKKLWYALKDAVTKTVVTGQKMRYRHITFGTFTRNNIRWLAMVLPSGKAVYYKNPAIEKRYIPGYEHMGKVDTVTHEGMNPYSKKWDRLSLSPGRITENATQGTAREIMAHGMLNVRSNIKEITLIGTVHDEALGSLKDEHVNDDMMNRFNNELCAVPWMNNCPLKAEGYFSKRYKKA